MVHLVYQIFWKLLQQIGVMRDKWDISDDLAWTLKTGAPTQQIQFVRRKKNYYLLPLPDLPILSEGTDTSILR